MLQQKLPAAEPPAYADAGNPGIFGSVKVHIGIPYIDALFRWDAQFCHSGKYRVRRRFAGNLRGFPNGGGNVWEKEIPAKPFYCKVKFIGNYGKLEALF